MARFPYVRVELDVTRSLRKHLKIKQPGGVWVFLPLKYERFPQFCFYCGVLGPAESTCHNFFLLHDKTVPKSYFAELQAHGRRQLSMVSASP